MKKNAFTLIELLAVIMILAIILVITVPNVQKALTTSFEKAYEFDLNTLKTTAKDYI
jgi:prepilin-type N-terminal cleavage/methylation domain-containing protein